MKTNKSIYLDHAAATPLNPAVLTAMQPYLGAEFANPSSLYAAARETRLAVEASRADIANVLGAKPTEIIFTSGGTEGNNLAIQGVLRAHPGAHWITSAIEHDAVLGCVEALKREGHAATIVPVQPSGTVALQAIGTAITDTTVLVSVMLANNEIGTIQPVADVAKLLAVVRADRAKRGVTLPLYLQTDAVQAANYLDLHVARLGVDLLTLNGSKIYGPKGTGALYVRHGTVLEPLMYGGGQERGRRSGTENVAGIVGLAAALKLAATTRDAESHRLTLLRDQLAAELTATIPGVILNGHPRHRLPNNLNLTIPGAEGEALVLYLDNAGIQASTGSACSTGNLDPSHVLLALGRTPAEANASLRLTLGRSTDANAVAVVAEKLPPIVARLRELQL
ncbi:MAG TPA: cysteine desulfurase family protein [Candidatus Saccharimonadia bacterium]|nr:cysteine desulfurase family protein [Candidatus Saccharimonadia bacterium]